MFGLFKKKPSEVGDIALGHMIGFIDGMKLPHVSSFNLAEQYILAEWLQVLSVISACGGVNKRALKIIENIAAEQTVKFQSYFIKIGMLSDSDANRFTHYLNQYLPKRREQYDVAVRKHRGFQEVAMLAFSNMVVGGDNNTNLVDSINLLNSYMENVANMSIATFKKLV